jgi:succinoglycan biosynthesis protein ExoA
MSDLPFVSVMIPMRNEAASIAACIESVLAQDYPEDRFEVLVVDGDSSDSSASVVEKFASRTGRVRLLHNPRRIVPTALNVAIRAARGGVVMRVDGHTRIAPDYLRAGVETLRRTGADNVGGPMCAIGGGPMAEAIAAATESRFGIGSYFHFGSAEAEVDTVYMGMYPRSVFERIGLFDEEMVRNQDDEFNYRLRKLGGRIVLTPAMRSWYQNRPTLHTLARQYFQYGFWKVRVLQKHPGQMSVRHFAPPALVGGLVVLPVAALWSPALGITWLALAGAYVVALTAVSALVARQRGWHLFFRLAAAFVTLHLSWGTGFVVGFGRFALRWFVMESPPPRLVIAGSEEFAWPRRATGG